MIYYFYLKKFINWAIIINRIIAINTLGIKYFIYYISDLVLYVLNRTNENIGGLELRILRLLNNYNIYDNYLYIIIIFLIDF